jgi:short-subunit dehydrogenase
MAKNRPQVALITGAASGIGRELARLLARDDTAIAAIDRNSEGLAGLEDELKRQNRTIASAAVDVTDMPALRENVARLEERVGPVDLLIACAGVGYETSAVALQAEEVTAVININLLGVTNSIAAVLPGMIQRQRGHLVAMSSLASFRGVPRMLAYCASKAGLNAFLDGLRVEVRPYNIAVTTICPGWIRTPMTAGLKLPGVQLLEVDEAARRMLRAIRRRRPFVAFPRSLAWRLGLLRWLPCPVSDWLLATMFRKLEKADT